MHVTWRNLCIDKSCDMVEQQQQQKTGTKKKDGVKRMTTEKHSVRTSRNFRQVKHMKIT